MRRGHVVFGLGLSAALCFGQTPAFNGPVSGVMFDAPSRAIRVVNGIPGAAYLGAAAVGEVDCAWLAPDGEKALAEKDGGRFFISGLRGSEPQWRAVEGPAERPDVVTWSRDSRAVAMSFRTAGEVRVMQLESGATEVFATKGVPGSVAALALKGETVFAAMAEAGGGGVYRQRGEENWLLMARVKGAAQLEMSGDGTLYALDAAAGSILAFQDAADSEMPAAEVLPDGAGEAAIAVRATADGKRLLVARSGEEPVVVVWDRNSRQEAARITLDGPPEELAPLPGSPHVLVTQRKKSGDVITILTERDSQFGVFFVPAGE